MVEGVRGEPVVLNGRVKMGTRNYLCKLHKNELKFSLFLLCKKAHFAVIRVSVIAYYI